MVACLYGLGAASHRVWNLARSNPSLGVFAKGHGSCHPLDIASCVLIVVMCARSGPITGLQLPITGQAQT